MAFTLTGAPTTAPSRRPISSVCSASRGRSHTTVQSAFTTRIALGPGQGAHPGQELEGVGPGPGRIGVGEVPAEIPEADGAEQGVGQGVGHHVGVAVPGQAGHTGDGDPPEDEGPAGER